MAVVSLLVVIGAYLAGTFPTALIVGRRAGRDPLREGSGNPGATNVYRVAGRRAGLTVALIDVAKGVLPTVAGYLVEGRGLATAAWAAAVIGHILPAFGRRRGGKGVATAAGGSFVLHPLVAIVLVGVFVAMVRLTRKVSAASLAIAVALPIGVALEGRPWWETAMAAAIAALVVARHRANVVRLVHGTEPTYRR